MRLYFLLTLPALAACEKAEKVEAPTRAEADRLDETEAMLNDLAADDSSSTETASDEPKHRGDADPGD